MAESAHLYPRITLRQQYNRSWAVRRFTVPRSYRSKNGFDPIEISEHKVLYTIVAMPLGMLLAHAVVKECIFWHGKLLNANVYNTAFQ